MRVLVHARGAVDELDMWPYVTRVDPMPDGSLLTVDVLDDRELVNALVTLTDRGLEVIRVQPLDG